jgi:leucyl-tRNA synthetase
MPKYNPATIEPKWQKYWEAERTFAAPRMPAPGAAKLYALDMFPYPSGDGLHVGHPEGYTATDIVCRAARMQGRSVLHPMGFDAFGLPAEEHAIKTGEHPRKQTEQNIATFRRQLKSLGFSYDWSRELATTDVEYFRWTQWIFLQIYDTWFDAEEQRGRPISELPIPEFFKMQGEDAVRQYQDDHRLAYQAEALVNWCPALGTVLANEEIVDGKSEVGGHPVTRIPLRQWMLRITAYAKRLEDDLNSLDWPDGVKALQRNWIGRSEGAEVDFFIGTTKNARPGMYPTDQEFEEWKKRRATDEYPKPCSEDVIRVYTTRPDTLFGATYLVLAPENANLQRLTDPQCYNAVLNYCNAAARKSDLDRTELAKVKTGVPTGSYAINPVNGQRVPIWVADYVLGSYGTGAIMAVPAHDERDFEFATKYDLPITPVVDPGDGVSADERAEVMAGNRCFAGDGVTINSQKYDGLMTAEFKKRIATDLAAAGIGREAVNYKLRDWLFSRQRFWGEPFPILHELDAAGKPTGRVQAVDAKDLPVDLPHLEDFKPHGRPEPPLDKAPHEWLYPVIDGKHYKRETNTMPQWAGSCWYYLRFIDPTNSQALVDRELEKAWMPIDLYVGGAEHAVLHLLYARFWHKVLYDRGIVSTAEPFQKLVNQGLILGVPEFFAWRRPDGTFVGEPQKDPAVEHLLADGRWFIEGQGEASRVQIANPKVSQVGKKYVWELHPNADVWVEHNKMSKSRGNVINPDSIVKEYGADSLRLYEMYMGPLEDSKPWSMQDVNGVHNFLNRVWRLVIDDRVEELALNASVVDRPATDEENRVLHKTIEAVTSDIDKLKFNTAIARMIEFTNHFTKATERPKAVLESFVLLLAPFAPHVAEELWQALGRTGTLTYEPWPKFDPALARDDTVEIPVQINGKVRAKVAMAAEADATTLEQAARTDERIAELLTGKQVVKTVVVPGRLVNFVVKG